MYGNRSIQATEEEDQGNRDLLDSSQLKLPYVVYWHYQNNNISTDVGNRGTDKGLLYTQTCARYSCIPRSRNRFALEDADED